MSANKVCFWRRTTIIVVHKYSNLIQTKERRNQKWRLYLLEIGSSLNALKTRKRATSGGIIIPDTAKEKPQEGEVIAVGKGRLLDTGERQPIDVSVAEKILFGKYSGTEVKFDGVEYLILREDDILAKMN